LAIREAQEVKEANLELVMQIEAMQNINSSLSVSFLFFFKKQNLTFVLWKLSS